MIIRALDLAELLSADGMGRLYPLGGTLKDSACPPQAIDPRRLPRGLSLLQLHMLTSDALEVFRKVENESAATLVIVGKLRDIVAYARACMVAVQEDVRPSTVVLGIIKVNKFRGYRYGGWRS